MKKKLIAVLCLWGMISVASACGFVDDNPSQSESVGGGVNSESIDTNESTGASEEAHQHAYGNATYVWDGDKCTATRTCACEENETETVTGVYVKDTIATCTSNEKGHYEATFENTAFVMQVTEANSVEVPDTMGEHAYEITYAWEGDKCTATNACGGVDCNEGTTETVTGTYVKDTEATCTANEKGHYEATFENTAFVMQVTEVNSVEIPDTMKEHVYGEATYTWAGDQCTATRACACTASEAETVTGVYIKDTDATCTVNEKGHYEATFANEAFAKQSTETNSVEVPETAKHTPTEAALEGREMVTRCSVCNEALETVPVYTTFNDGESICDPALGYALGDYAIPMTELEGKALRFEFKFETDGSFNICLLGSDWANITGYFTVAKSGDNVTTTAGRVVALSDGWYAWELNKKAFAGDGASRATEVGLFYATEAVKGTVMIDFTSFAAVDMYRSGTTFTDGAIIGGTTGLLLGTNAVPMTSLENKALHFEFKFETDGSFNICLLAADWANVTGYFTVTKSGDNVTTTAGRVVALSDGWYAWELNKRAFAGDGASRATEVGLVYTTTAVTGTVVIDFTSFAAVNMYRNGTTYANGEVIGGANGYQFGTYAVPMTELSGKALRFEFKIEGDGSFNICLLAADWANVTGYFTVTKSGDSVTATTGRIVDLGDGWYAWEQNASDFAGDGVSRAANVGMVYATEAVTGTVIIDWSSLSAVDVYSA